MGELGASIRDLEAIVQGKTNNVRVVEEGIIDSIRPNLDFLSVSVANTTCETISFEAKNGRRSAADSIIVNGQEL